MVNLSISPGRGSGCESTSNLPSIKMLQLLVYLKAARNCFLNNKTFSVKKKKSQVMERLKQGLRHHQSIYSINVKCFMQLFSAS